MLSDLKLNMSLLQTHAHTHVHIQIHTSFLRLNDNRNSFTQVEGRPWLEPMAAAGCAHSWAPLQPSLRPSCFTSSVKMFLSPRQFLTNPKLMLSARCWILGWVLCLTATLSVSCPFPSAWESCNTQQQAGCLLVLLLPLLPCTCRGECWLVLSHMHTFSGVLIQPWKKGFDEAKWGYYTFLGWDVIRQQRKFWVLPGSIKARDRAASLGEW